MEGPTQRRWQKETIVSPRPVLLSKEPVQEIDLQDLIKFWKEPIEYYYKTVLKLYLNDEEEEQKDSEHFELTSSTNNNLEPYLLNIQLNSLPDSNSQASNTVILKNVFFDSGLSVLQPESNTELDALANLLNENPSLRLKIKGHTDNIGRPQNNLKLSNERALAVKNYLVNKGIEEQRLSAIGLGATNPIESNETPEGRAANRRTEIEAV